MKAATFKILCAALLSGAFLAWGDDPPRDDGHADGTDPPVRLSNDGVLSEHLAMYDVDNSGGLSLEEYQLLQADRLTQARHLKMRLKWDLNRDGRIDARERLAAVQQNKKAIEERRIRRFNEVDTDSDEFLSETEFLQINAVTASDLESPGIGVELFRHLDHDGDGRVSKLEFLRTLDKLRPTDPLNPDPAPKPRGDTNPLKEVAPIRPAAP